VKTISNHNTTNERVTPRLVIKIDKVTGVQTINGKVIPLRTKKSKGKTITQKSSKLFGEDNDNDNGDTSGDDSVSLSRGNISLGKSHNRDATRKTPINIQQQAKPDIKVINNVSFDTI